MIGSLTGSLGWGSVRRVSVVTLVGSSFGKCSFFRRPVPFLVESVRLLACMFAPIPCMGVDSHVIHPAVDPAPF